MGNQNVSKRTYRKEYSSLFEGLLKIHKIKQQSNPNQKQNDWDPDFECEDLRVFVRKRPLFDYEAANGEFDVITTHENRVVEVHDARQAPDLKPMKAYMEHISIPFPPGSVFDEKATTADVYAASLQELIPKFVKDQENVTCFMFGQTGSGKTYTISGMMKLMAKELFGYLKTEKDMQFLVSAIELVGETAFDLLNEERSKVSLLENGKGVVEVVGQQSFFITSPENLVESYMYGANNRETAATQCNSTSSRSHYIFSIKLVHSAQPDLALATFNLLDLAGSERNENTLYHQADRIKEQCQINTSLMCLKNCMRVWTEQRKLQMKGDPKRIRIPYRESKLTLFLRDCFESVASFGNMDDSNSFNQKPHSLVLIATVSPAATDTEHSTTTLKHASELFCDSSKITSEKYVVEDHINEINNLAKGKNILDEEEKLMEVVEWDTERTRDWLGKVKKGAFKKYVAAFPATTDGKQLSRFPVARLTQIMGDPIVAQKLREEISKEMNRITLEKRKRVNEKKAIVKPKGLY